MIKSDKGAVNIKGSEAVICTDYTMITRGLVQTIAEKEGQEYAEKAVRDAFDLAFKNVDEIKDELISLLNKFLEEMGGN